jgi:DNA-binding transcriptional MerR regulator
MNTSFPTLEPSYRLADLCLLADLPIRTVRYYVQIGLVDRPQGETRAARYGAAHLEQLLLIKKWAAAGVSLERIRDLLHGEPPPVEPRQRAHGTVEIRSHLLLAEGIELVIDVERAGLSSVEVRRLIREIIAAHTRLIEESAKDSTDNQNEG